MYRDLESQHVDPASSSGFPIDQLHFNPSSKSGLTRILTGAENVRIQRFYTDDFDQRMSKHLLAVESFPEPPSGPDCFEDISPSLTTSLSQDNLSLSPAALFLSSFSPSLDMSTPSPLPDDQGETVAGHVLGPVVGHGASSTIRTATSPSGDTVAIKIVRRADVLSSHNRLVREAEVWASLHHEHILPLFTSEHTSYADYFITQYCPAGSLFDILKRDGQPALPQDDVGTMFRQVVRGLQYMHEVAGYVHGDVKLENVLVDEMGVCKIGDFGMAKKIGGESAHGFFSPPRMQPKQQTLHTHLSLNRPTRAHGTQTMARHRNSTPTHNALSPSPSQIIYQEGSLPYASPELLLPRFGTPYFPHPAQDIWALGVMLYTLLTGQLPFMDSFEPRLQIKILNGNFEMPSGIGRGAERVLRGCLETTVTNRWTLSEVDEVGWGIGWGEEGDSAAPSDDEIDDPAPFSLSRRSSSAVSSRRSRSRVRGDGRCYSPLPKVISRRTRSSSRTSSRSASCNHGRYITPSVPVPPVLTRSTVTDRGRQRTKFDIQSYSRSVSPSIAPMTPPDPSDEIRRLFFYPMKSRTPSSEWRTEAEGEFTQTRGRRSSVLSPSPGTSIRDNRALADLADIEENAKWDGTADALSRDPDLHGASYERRNGKVSRAGSVPPRHVMFSKTSWSSSQSCTSPIPIPRKNQVSARSRSVGFEPDLGASPVFRGPLEL